jgi:hypothetical protein
MEMPRALILRIMLKFSLTKSGDKPSEGQQIIYTAKMENLLARPRTPTAVLELRGAFKNHPCRLRDRKCEPLVTTVLPEPPRRLPKPVKLMWREMGSHGFWLTSADRFMLEIAATLMAAHRADGQKSADTALLIKVLNTGFSPAERRKLNLPTNYQTET